MQIDYWMWFDNSTIPLADKINGGAMAFQQKFGQRPVVCKLNMAHVNGHNFVGDVELEPVTNVPVNNFWFGGERIECLKKLALLRF